MYMKSISSPWFLKLLFNTGFLLFTVTGCFFVSCEKDNKDALFIYKEATHTGISFVNSLPESADFNILNYLYYYNGGGVSIGDINNDGLDDVYFTSNLEKNRLYLNQGDLKFKDITEDSHVGGAYDWSNGCNMVDINADGYLDIYVCNLGNFDGKTGRNELFLNNGDGTFREAAAEYQLDFSTFSTQSCFFDYDRDGDLDMYLLNHAIHTIDAYVPRNRIKHTPDTLSGDRLLRNNADQGLTTFTDVTQEAGLYSNPVGFGLAVAAADINGDGWTDLYVSNDFHENDYLYLNNGKGGFDEQHAQWFGHTSKYSMGSDVNDINNDGLPDVMTLDMMPELPEVLQKSMAEDHYTLRKIILEKGYAPQLSRNTMQLNQNGRFLDVAPYMGVEATDWSWSPLFMDLDNDGYKDLYITNGIYRRPNDMDYLNYTSNAAIQSVMGQKNEVITKKLIELMPQMKIENKTYHNQNGEDFEEVNAQWRLNRPSHSNGVAYADLDNDGDLDLVVNNINEEAFVIENRHAQQNPKYRSLNVKLYGNALNPTGIGAKIKVVTQNNRIFHEQQPSRGFMSSVSHMIHIGVGEVETINELQVVWPDGSFEVVKDIPVSKTHHSYQKNAQGDYYAQTTEPKPKIFTEEKGLLSFEHQENEYHDTYVEELIPRLLSREGPGMAVADVNGDGLEDVFITGASGREDALFLQDARGNLTQSQQPAFVPFAEAEGVDALFIDADGDQDQDLYVVTAGNERAVLPQLTQDLLFLNDGNGTFTQAENSGIPSGQHAVVKASDIDQDGDLDLFVGARVMAGEYGKIPKSHVLLNKGDGNFKPLTNGAINQVGMVTDAAWVDLDADGWQDLVVVGEWMAITVFRNNQGNLEKIKAPKGLENTEGWWNALLVEDLDNDGDPDFVVGNIGLNTKLSASAEHPIKLYCNDFDTNGTVDPIITSFTNGKEYPLATKDQLMKQLPMIKKKFPSYNTYSGTTIEAIFDEEQLADSQIKVAKQLASVVVENKGDFTFEIYPLPMVANFSSLNSMVAFDANGDGLKDLIVAGNFYHLTPPLGRQDASLGFVGINQGGMLFRFQDPASSGLLLKGEVRKLQWLNGFKAKYLLGARNNAPAVVYKMKANGKD